MAHPAPSSAPGPDAPAPGATAALALLLAINLFNYIDRQVLSAVLPRLEMDGTLFAPDDPDTKFWLGLLPSAFMVAYMVFSPIVGWLDGHGYRRWVILGLGVTVWSLASGGSGFATTYWALLATRCLVGVGEGAYGPVASAMLADIYPARLRGLVMALFNMAIPVGSALGFVIGGQVSGYFNDWRHAFWVTFAGLGLGVLCFTRRELPRPPRAAEVDAPGYFTVLGRLARNPSFALCCAGMTAVTFVLGGLAAWLPAYIFEREARFALTPAVLTALADPSPEANRRPVPAEVVAKLAPKADGQERNLADLKAYLSGSWSEAEAARHFESVTTAAVTKESPTLAGINTAFGAIVVIGGLVATAVGAWLGEWLRPRVRGGYFWVIGGGALASLPAYYGFLYTPFPLGWGLVFFAVFGLFLHTGPAFTALANVVTSEVRATAFAINILVIHALGDVISPPLIGLVASRSSLHTAFLLTGGMVLLGGVLWLTGVPFLDADTRRATDADAGNPRPV
ncbi:MAG: MFS transporter [Gemmataceae bacterium]